MDNSQNGYSRVTKTGKIKKMMFSGHGREKFVGKTTEI